MIEDVMVAFCAILHFPHPKSKNIKRVHRIVVHPDYQGLGIGTRMLNYLGDMYIKNGYRFTIVTSNVALSHSFKRDDCWKLKSASRKPRHSGLMGLNNTSSSNRFTMSWEYIIKP